MIDAATTIQNVIGDLDVESLGVDTLRRDAVLWNFMVLGEAANQLPRDFKAAHPEIEWSKPTQLRNKIVHGYWNVSLQILHDTARQVLPAFVERLTASLMFPDAGADEPHSGH
ncbi:HepT-like ribonuclease domain-containing protein [Nocardioides sp.]|uniref:HepT-like ribonuclease domain-containing protein n=1 Tax=Nocardioides sp. TaxID=35761 RepID=UPI0026396B7C|nr:HepT-like ribonuclease domain-containing protein [Nocardioides sp.]